MAAPRDKIALVYDDDAYVELLQKRANAPPDAAQGLMGRQVAGHEFLDAYLNYGRWDEMVALVFGQASRQSLINRFSSHPSIAGSAKKLRIVARNVFHNRFFPTAPAGTLHFPCPFDVRYAWARHHAGPAAFALSGLTHTISTATVMRGICEMVSGPLEPFDVLVCISRAAVDVVKSVTDGYAAFLKERYGGEPKLRARIAHIPLGVNSDKYRPATLQERNAKRAELGIAEDAIVVLFVGRLTYSGKVHPFPMLDGVAAAARATGKPVHIVMSGWSPADEINKNIAEGARAFAPNVKLTIVDGTQAQHRFSVWHTADIFTSLTDNIQETLSQTILEAGACGLPIVASEWDGCRDQVADGETGFLVPARMVRGATNNLSSRLLIDEMPYGAFLADCNQTVAVDPVGAAEAFRKLISDAALRKRMGEAGRARAMKLFSWENIVHAYEDLWAEQEIERQAYAARLAGGVLRQYATPVLFPEVEQSFASYPFSILDEADTVQTSPGAMNRLDGILSTPLSNYRPENRCADRAILAGILNSAGEVKTISELDQLFSGANVNLAAARATIAWMLKYGLLNVAE